MTSVRPPRGCAGCTLAEDGPISGAVAAAALVAFAAGWRRRSRSGSASRPPATLR